MVIRSNAGVWCDIPSPWPGCVSGCFYTLQWLYVLIRILDPLMFCYFWKGIQIRGLLFNIQEFRKGKIRGPFIDNCLFWKDCCWITSGFCFHAICWLYSKLEKTDYYRSVATCKQVIGSSWMFTKVVNTTWQRMLVFFSFITLGRVQCNSGLWWGGQIWRIFSGIGMNVV